MKHLQRAGLLLASLCLTISTGCAELQQAAADYAAAEASGSGSSAQYQASGGSAFSGGSSQTYTSDGGGSSDYGSSDRDGERRPDAIVVGGVGYVQVGKNPHSGGFSYNGRGYAIADRQIEGMEFVQGDSRRDKNGFWQNGQWWVPTGRYVWSGGGGGWGGGGQGGGHVINIDGRSFVEQSNNRGKGDGFYQNGKWYVRADRNLRGQEYVRSGSGQSGGFNYNGNYYVPAGHHGGGGGGGRGDGGQGGGGAHYINLGGNTYAGTNNRGNRGGFDYNGTYYEPWNRHVKGQQFVIGDPSRQKNGFYQNGKWWVPGN